MKLFVTPARRCLGACILVASLAVPCEGGLLTRGNWGNHLGIAPLPKSREVALQQAGSPGHGKEHVDRRAAMTEGAADGAHHDEGVEQPDVVSTSLALMLLGTVAWVMSLFYFVNFPDKDIVDATWHMLSGMISIFCAVLIFSASTEMLVDFAGGSRNDHHRPPTLKMLAISFIRFLVLFGLVQAAFFSYRRPCWLLSCFATIGAHLVGFAAIDAFGSFLQFPFFSSSMLGFAFGVVLAAVALVAIFHKPHLMRQRVEDGTEEWRNECADAGVESVGLALGLLVSMLIRFAIAGHLPPVHGAPKNKTEDEIMTLFMTSMLFVPFIMCATVVRYRLIDRGVAAPSTIQLVYTLQETLSMAMGWCFLYWGYWEFYAWTDDKGVGAGGRMTQRVIMALVFSFFAFSAIVVIDFLADHAGAHVEKGLRALLDTLALLMGLSWEATFTESVECLADQYTGRTRTLVCVGVTLCLVAVVLPAWALYILPHTFEANEEMRKETYKSPRMLQENQDELDSAEREARA